MPRLVVLASVALLLLGVESALAQRASAGRDNDSIVFPIPSSPDKVPADGSPVKKQAINDAIVEFRYRIVPETGTVVEEAFVGKERHRLRRVGRAKRRILDDKPTWFFQNFTPVAAPDLRYALDPKTGAAVEETFVNGNVVFRPK